MRVEKLALKLLRNEEWFQFAKEFKTMAEAELGGNVQIAELLATFIMLYGNADEVLEQIRKSGYTTQVVDADSLRDKTFGGFRNVVKGMLSHFDPAKQRSAENLMIVFDQYGNLTEKSYSQETASLYNFLQEMKGKFAPDVAALGLDEWVSYLEQNNLDFERLVMERNEEQSEKTSLKMKAVRRELDDCYVEIVKRLEAITILQSDHTLAPLINKLNSNIARYKNTLAQRKGKSVEKKSELIDAYSSKKPSKE